MKRRGRAWLWLACCALACSADQAADRSAENGGAATATTPRASVASEHQSAPRLLIDVREPRAFAAGHALGATETGLDGSFVRTDGVDAADADFHHHVQSDAGEQGEETQAGTPI